jgi:hypothetical protein
VAPAADGVAMAFLIFGVLGPFVMPYYVGLGGTGQMVDSTDRRPMATRWHVRGVFGARGSLFNSTFGRMKPVEDVQD